MEPAKEIYTIEIRDGRGIPCVQARVDAENPIEALILAPQAGDPVERVFLREVSYGELDSMLGYPRTPRMTRSRPAPEDKFACYWKMAFPLGARRAT